MKMKKNTLFKILLLVVLVLSFATYTYNFLDDDDASASLLAIFNYSPYEYLMAAVLSENGAFLPLNYVCDLSPSKIFYIRMHEKSPPAAFSSPLV